LPGARDGNCWHGWLYWTYDTHEQPRLWNAAHDDFAIFRILADQLKRGE
jgi:hypothetical protein